MKKSNLILGIFIALITFSACNKEDEIILTPEELIVQYSPWSFTGLELVNIVNNGNIDFDKQQWEDDIDSDTGDLTFIFKTDGTVSFIKKNPPNPDKVEYWNWEIIDGDQLKFYKDDSDDITLFYDLKVTETHLEFALNDIEVDDNVIADVKYLFNK